jgi:hypothetical protein
MAILKSPLTYAVTGYVGGGLGLLCQEAAIHGFLVPLGLEPSPGHLCNFSHGPRSRHLALWWIAHKARWLESFLAIVIAGPDVCPLGRRGDAPCSSRQDRTMTISTSHSTVRVEGFSTRPNWC